MADKNSVNCPSCGASVGQGHVCQTNEKDNEYRKMSHMGMDGPRMRKMDAAMSKLGMMPVEIEIEDMDEDD